MTGISQSGHLVARYLLSVTLYISFYQALGIEYFTCYGPSRKQFHSEEKALMKGLPSKMWGGLSKTIRNAEEPRDQQEVAITILRPEGTKGWNSAFRAQSPRGGPLGRSHCLAMQQLLLDLRPQSRMRVQKKYSSLFLLISCRCFPLAKYKQKPLNSLPR